MSGEETSARELTGVDLEGAGALLGDCLLGFALPSSSIALPWLPLLVSLSESTVVPCEATATVPSDVLAVVLMSDSTGISPKLLMISDTSRGGISLASISESSPVISLSRLSNVKSLGNKLDPKTSSPPSLWLSTAPDSVDAVLPCDLSLGSVGSLEAEVGVAFASELSLGKVSSEASDDDPFDTAECIWSTSIGSVLETDFVLSATPSFVDEFRADVLLTTETKLVILVSTDSITASDVTMETEDELDTVAVDVLVSELLSVRLITGP